MKKEDIQKLISFGWVPRPHYNFNESHFYLSNVYDITHLEELHQYTEYVPLQDEAVYITYEIYPNLGICHYCIWSEYDKSTRKWDYADYDRVVKLSLENRLIVYPHWLQIIAKDNGLTINQLAKRCGLHHSTLYNIIKRNTRLEHIKLSTLKAILKGLDMTLDDFIKKYLTNNI